MNEAVALPSTTTTASTTSPSKWTLTIKTVGPIKILSPFASYLKSEESLKSNDDGNNGETSFNVEVDPDDALSSLGRKIESVTGLDVRRQRLIYRGRILTVDYDDDDDDGGGAEIGVGLKSEGELERKSYKTEGEGGAQETVDETNDRGVISFNESPSAIAHSPSLDDGDVDDTPVTRQNSRNDAMDMSDEAIARSVNEYFNLIRERVDDSETTANNANNVSHGQPDFDLARAFATATTERDTLSNLTDAKKDDIMDAKQPAKAHKPKQRVRDVKGLNDGHTIHLVPRPAPETPNPITSAAAAAAAASNTTTRTSGTEASPFSNLFTGNTTNNTGEGGPSVTSISGPEGMNLLAALLGMSNGDVEVGSGPLGRLDELASNSNNAGSGGTGGTGATQTVGRTGPNTESLSRLATNLSNNRIMLRRGGGSSSARARAAAARLTEADVRARDPGSVEPVRQGLMTLHTLLGNALFRDEGNNNNNNNNSRTNVEEGKVAEEEEEKVASIMEEGQVLLPFPPARPVSTNYYVNQLQSNRQWYRGQWLDALDTVNQWLEATVVDIVLPSDILSTGSHSSFDDNATSNNVTPSKKVRRRTPDAVVSANDLEGRRRLLLEPCPPNEQTTNPELSLIDAGYRQRPDNAGVQLLLIHYNGWPHRWDEWIRSDSERIRPFRTRTRHRSTSQFASPTPSNVFQAAPATHIMDEDDEVERVSLLPELQRVLSSVNDILGNVVPLGQEEDTTPFAPSTDTAHLPWRLPNHGLESNLSTDSDASVGRRRGDSLSRLDGVQLRRLAPLIDRLGRTLTDAAPHIACLADSLPPPLANASPPCPSFSPSLLGEEAPQTMAARVREMNAWASRISNDPFNPGMEEANDPDLSDYINGMVNTSRSANRNERDSRDPLVTGLLSNYLSSQGGSGSDNNDVSDTLGRLIRMGGGTNGGGRNGDGPGIDIHIHAVVTGPGMNTLGGGGGGGTTGTTMPLHSILRNGNSSSANRNFGIARPVSTQALNEDDQGLFSELYSESPTPLNMHGSTAASVKTDETDDVSQVFEECRSIEDESESCDLDDVEATDEATDNYVPVLVAEVVDVEETPSSTTEDADEADEAKTPAEVPSTENNIEIDDTDNLPAPQAAPVSPNINNSTHNSEGSINTISEIGSTDSSPSQSPAQVENSSTTPQAESISSSSLTSRLYRRTFGRLSGVNHRRPGGNGNLP